MHIALTTGKLKRVEPSYSFSVIGYENEIQPEMIQLLYIGSHFMGH